MGETAPSPTAGVLVTTALGARDVHVWRASLPAPGPVVEACARLLSPDEHARASRMLAASRREAFVVARGLLRRLTGRYVGLPAADVGFSYTALGRPLLAADDRSLQFSVSHSGDQVLLAFAVRARVGVDIERVRASADVDAIAHRFFAAGELAELAALAGPDRLEAFFACWTRKEALLKAVGLGISRGLGRVEVSCRPGEPARLVRSALDELDPANWSLADLTFAPGYRAALAVSMANPAVSVFAAATDVVLGKEQA